MQIKDYISYKIKTGDTLKSLATRIGLHDYKQLRNFHNKICKENEHLTTLEIIKGETLYVPDLQEVINLNKAAKNTNSKNTKTKPFKLNLSLLNATYIINIIKETARGAQVTTNDISYKLIVKNVINNENTHVIRVIKSNFLINNKKPQSKMQQLALLCSKNYYPIDLIISNKGNILGIDNMLDIRERWKENKTNIEATFNGDYAEKYINNINNLLLNTNKLEEVIKSDLVINTLLQPYKRLNRLTKTSYNTTLGKHNINYKISQEVEKVDDLKNNFIITQKGKIEDSRSYKDIIDSSAKNNPFYVKLPQIKGSLLNKFNVDIKLDLTQKINAKHKVEFTKNKIKTTTINLILKNN